jgi:hypothetical protein
MATPRDLLPTKYEVLRLRNGIEICGMTRDTGAKIVITLPMICRLSAPSRKETLATFYPYAPLTSDYNIEFPYDYIVHRNNMNTQYIPFYDEASSQWMSMIENNSIPLIDPKEFTKAKDYMDDVLQTVIDDMRKNRLEDEDHLYYEDHYEEFERLKTPKDKKKIH